MILCHKIIVSWVIHHVIRKQPIYICLYFSSLLQMWNTKYKVITITAQSLYSWEGSLCYSVIVLAPVFLCVVKWPKDLFASAIIYVLSPQTLVKSCTYFHCITVWQSFDTKNLILSARYLFLPIYGTYIFWHKFDWWHLTPSTHTHKLDRVAKLGYCRDELNWPKLDIWVGTCLKVDYLRGEFRGEVRCDPIFNIPEDVSGLEWIHHHNHVSPFVMTLYATK